MMTDIEIKKSIKKIVDEFYKDKEKLIKILQEFVLDVVYEQNEKYLEIVTETFREIFKNYRVF